MGLKSIRERAWELGDVAASSSPSSVLVFHIRGGKGSLESQYLQAESPWAALEERGCAGSFPSGMMEVMRWRLLKDDEDNAMGLLSLRDDRDHMMGDSSAEHLTWSSNRNLMCPPVYSECFFGVHLKTVC